MIVIMQVGIDILPRHTYSLVLELFIKYFSPYLACLIPFYKFHSTTYRFQTLNFYIAIKLSFNIQFILNIYGY